MKLIVLCGPQASGKQTIANELCKLTGFTSFDKHEVIGILTRIYPEFDAPLYKLSYKIRLQILEYAALRGVSMVTTNVCYDEKRSMDFLRNIVSAIEAHGGSVAFVRVTAPKSVLLQRVAGESRHQPGKVTDKELLEEIFVKRRPDTPPPFDHITIDSSETAVSESARIIVEHLGL